MLQSIDLWEPANHLSVEMHTYVGLHIFWAVVQHLEYWKPFNRQQFCQIKGLLKKNFWQKVQEFSANSSQIIIFELFPCVLKTADVFLEEKKLVHMIVFKRDLRDIWPGWRPNITKTNNFWEFKFKITFHTNKHRHRRNVTSNHFFDYYDFHH